MEYRGPPEVTLPRIFVVNMRKDVARREVMASRAKEASIEIEFFEAVNGRELTPGQLGFYDRNKRLRYFGRDLLPGELGCIRSHHNIYEKMVAENIPVAVVLEDDVLLESDVRSVFSALMETKTPWNMIRFLGSKKIYKRGCRIIAPLVGRYSLARLPTTPGGTHGYMIKQDAAKRMLEHTSKSWLPIDAVQGRTWETGIETLVVHPAPMRPDDQETSTIGDQRFDKTLKIKGVAKLLYPLNRAFYKLEEAVGKKYIYWSSWLRDRRHE